MNALLRAIALVFLLVVPLAGAAEPEVGKPFFVIAPTVEGKSPAAIEGVKLLTSNNNLAIALHGERLYFAFRTATHHHPKPPLWVWGKPGFEKWEDARTRLYVLSAPATAESLRDLEKTAPTLAWRLEFEAKEKAGIVAEDDFREPLFLSLGGRLHLYFSQIEGKPMQFKVLRTWHTELGKEGKWTKPAQVLTPKELHWDIAVRREGEQDVAYLTSYSGDHYEASSKEPQICVHLKRSTDGIKWDKVGSKDCVVQGGTSEAAIAFHPTTGELWSVIRNEDGDKRGWGTLFATATDRDFGAWDISPEADPRRFDSPRLFVNGDDVYLIARQNIVKGKDGSLDETINHPFDGAFLGRTEEKGRAERKRVLDQIAAGKASFSSTNPLNLGVTTKYMQRYHFDEPKRTALYRLDKKTREPKLVVQLPSAGDTAFASILSLGGNEYLVANYTSDLTRKKATWNEGQNARTGIYFTKISFR